MPLLSVIVPTHNRQRYCAQIVPRLLEVLPDAEIIISDTSADDSLKDLLRDSLQSGRLVYLRPNRPMDVVTHFNFAFEHATGDYLISIGDDDFVGPHISEVAAWAKREGVEAVVSYRESFLAWYFWPGVKSKYYGDKYARRMFILPFDGSAHKIDTRAALKGVLRNFGRGLGAMPRAYHGLIARSLVERIRAKYGALFGGVSPDIYSATLISLETRNAWIVDFPFCLPGGSPSSTAGTGAAHTDNRSLKGNPHTAAFKNLVWDPLIPEFYSPLTVWGYSLLKAVETVGDPHLRPNFGRLYACCFLYERPNWAQARASFAIYAGRIGLLKAIIDVVSAGIVELTFQARRFGKRLLNPRPGGEAVSVCNLDDVFAAYEAIGEYAAKAGVTPALPRAAELIEPQR